MSRQNTLARAVALYLPIPRRRSRSRRSRSITTRTDDRSTMSKSNTQSTPTDETTDAQSSESSPHRGGPPSIPDADLLDILRDLAAEVGHTPTTAEMRDLGPHSPSTYDAHFGSWTAACEAAGLDPRPSTTALTVAELSTALCTLADELGRTPTSEEMRRLGPHDSSTYYRRYDSWPAACKAAGLSPPTRETPSFARIPLPDLLDDLRMGALALGRPPLGYEIDSFGEYSSLTYRKRFGSWEHTLYIAGVTDRDGKVTHGSDGSLVLAPPRIPFTGEVQPPVTASVTSVEEATA